MAGLPPSDHIGGPPTPVTRALPPWRSSMTALATYLENMIRREILAELSGEIHQRAAKVIIESGERRGWGWRGAGGPPLWSEGGKPAMRALIPMSRDRELPPQVRLVPAL